MAHFKARGRGQVVNVSSSLGRVPSVVHRSAYSASKHFLNALTANLRDELAPSHPAITVSLVSPGLTFTEFGKNALHGGADEVRFAIEQFRAVRIQHGIGAMQDPEVVELLVERGIACDVCPGSNLALHAVESAEAHPLPRMLEAGVTVTLATDDPPMFHTNLLDEYERAWQWCGLDEDGLRKLADASLRVALGR